MQDTDPTPSGARHHSSAAKRHTRTHAPGRPLRIYILGTDTAVGKTHVTCCLLRAAATAGIRVIPFKPAQSGTPGARTDAQRLLEAAGLPSTLEPSMAPWNYDVPVAPGLAESSAHFIPHGIGDTSRLDEASDRLRAWETAQTADYTIIEGAGGVHVPMPGGTWQIDWIQALGDLCILVGRAGLGTINHCLLSIDALAAHGCPPAAFLLNACHPPDSEDPSVPLNAAVIEHARRLPSLGTLPYGTSIASPQLLTSVLRLADAY